MSIPDASVCITKDFVKSGRRRTGARVIADFRLSKAVFVSLYQIKESFFNNSVSA